MRIGVLVVIACGLPIAALAGPVDYATRDPGCTHMATVQYLDCEVAVVYSCPAVAGLAAPTFREEAFKQAGLDHYSVATRNGAPLISANTAGTFAIEADPATLVETPLEEVVKTGHGSFTSTGVIRFAGAQKPVTMSVDLATVGAPQSFDGRAAIAIEAHVAVQIPPPMGAIVSIEKGFLLPDLGLYVSGEATAGTFFKPDQTPHRPLSIALPGQAGFDTTKPESCGSLSLLVPPLGGTGGAA